MTSSSPGTKPVVGFEPYETRRLRFASLWIQRRALICSPSVYLVVKAALPESSSDQTGGTQRGIPAAVLLPGFDGWGASVVSGTTDGGPVLGEPFGIHVCDFEA